MPFFFFGTRQAQESCSTPNFSWKPVKRLSLETGCKKRLWLVLLDHKERQTQESTKYQEALIQNANPQREPSTPTICTFYTQGCRSTSRQRHLPAQESPSPQLKCPIPSRFTIRHFRIRSRKPGHRAVSKLDNRKHLGPWESCSFQPSAEGFKETSSYSHVLQLKFPPEWDVCIGFIGKTTTTKTLKDGKQKQRYCP